MQNKQLHESKYACLETLNMVFKAFILENECMSVDVSPVNYSDSDSDDLIRNVVNLFKTFDVLAN